MPRFQDTLVRRNAIRSPSKRSFAIDRLSQKLMGFGLPQFPHCQVQILSDQSGKVKESDVVDTILSRRCYSYPERSDSDEIDIDELYAECLEPWGGPVTSMGEASGSGVQLFQSTSDHRYQSDKETSWELSKDDRAVSSQGTSYTSLNLGVSRESIARLQRKGKRAPRQAKLSRFLMCETIDIKLGLGSDHDSYKGKGYMLNKEDNCDHLRLPNGEPDNPARLIFFRERLWENFEEWKPESHMGYQPCVKRVVRIKQKKVLKASRLGREVFTSSI